MASVPLFACLGIILPLGFAQVAPVPAETRANPAGNAVVARIDSKPVTVDDLTALAKATGNLDALKANPRDFLFYYAFCYRLLSYAEAHQLDQEGTTKATLETQRKQLLLTAAVDWFSRHVEITPVEVEVYYKNHLKDFRKGTGAGSQPKPLAEVSDEILKLLQRQETDKWIKRLIASTVIVSPHEGKDK
jgi:hypothetical protein